MAQDVQELSPDAKKIFGNLKPYFPSDPWGNSCWDPSGLVFNNIWYDLRNSEARNRLIDQEKQTIGYQVQIEASLYVKKNNCVSNGELGWMTNFTYHHFSRSVQHNAELLLLLLDLDFQIETLDIV